MLAESLNTSIDNKDQPLDRYVSGSQVAGMLGITMKTLGVWVKEKKFPAPYKIGGYCNRWKLSEVNAHIESSRGAA